MREWPMCYRHRTYRIEERAIFGLPPLPARYDLAIAPNVDYTTEA